MGIKYYSINPGDEQEVTIGTMGLELREGEVIFHTENYNNKIEYF